MSQLSLSEEDGLKENEEMEVDEVDESSPSPKKKQKRNEEKTPVSREKKSSLKVSIDGRILKLAFFFHVLVNQERECSI